MPKVSVKKRKPVLEANVGGKQYGRKPVSSGNDQPQDESTKKNYRRRVRKLPPLFTDLYIQAKENNSSDSFDDFLIGKVMSLNLINVNLCLE